MRATPALPHVMSLHRRPEGDIALTGRRSCAVRHSRASPDWIVLAPDWTALDCTGLHWTTADLGCGETRSPRRTPTHVSADSRTPAGSGLPPPSTLDGSLVVSWRVALRRRPFGAGCRLRCVLVDAD